MRFMGPYSKPSNIEFYLFTKNKCKFVLIKPIVELNLLSVVLSLPVFSLSLLDLSYYETGLSFATLLVLICSPLPA